MTQPSDKRSPVWGILLLVLIWSAPSYLVAALFEHDHAAMLAGVLTFVGLIIAVRSVALITLERPIVQQAIRDAFRARLFMIVFFPVALVNDVIVGGISLLFVTILSEAVGGIGSGALYTYLATCFEGVLLLGEMLIFASIAFDNRRHSNVCPAFKGKCLACGYDLRGNAGICPECGAAVGAALRSSASARSTPRSECRPARR